MAARSLSTLMEVEMTEHGSPNIFPALRYRDANAAIEWLKEAFGFAEHAVYRADDGSVQHAQLRLGAGVVMLGEAGGSAGDTPKDDPSVATTIYVVVDDPDAHCDQARAAGAEIVREPVDQDYGGRDYTARDPDGHLWSFGTYDPYQTTSTP
jgi:uncharacterized glyoxalase superfamily protein PhnB